MTTTPIPGPAIARYLAAKCAHSPALVCAACPPRQATPRCPAGRSDGACMPADHSACPDLAAEHGRRLGTDARGMTTRTMPDLSQVAR